MSRGKASGITLKKKDAEIVLGMVNRGDREHDIAAWFGVNQGRIAEVKTKKKFPTAVAASPHLLPPKGPPGIKGRRLRAAVGTILSSAAGGGVNLADLIQQLQDAADAYDAHEV